VPDAQKPDFAQRLADFESSTFTELRPGQKLVLEEYAANHMTTADLAIEMPTGEGKTLIALLIADWALEQGLSVAYLTGTRQLAERVEQEAELLGLDVVRFSGKNYGGAKLDDYHQAEKPGIMNYWVYFNSNPVPQPADLVILDDAHLAEQPLSGLRTLRIQNKQGDARKLYESICDLVLAHTGDAYPALRSMREGVAAPGTPPELLSFGDWAEVVDAVRDAITDSPYATDDAKYVWRAVQGDLTRCGVLIGPSTVEIRPYHPPTQLVPGYAQAKQRIYLSATLGSMDDLQRRIGGGQVTRLTPATPLPAGATGHRQLVLNPTGKPALDDDVLEWALEQVVAADGRAAWLCASNAEADALVEKLEEEAERVFRLRAGDDDQVEAWIAAGEGQLVTAGRYDGLDLPGDVCKLVIITSVPQASSEYERFVVAYLGDATFMRHRVGQRVTQALGRANRTPADRSLYLGLDPTFAQMLADPAVRKSIPADTTPVIREALELYDEGWQAAQDACAAFWATGEPVGDETPPAGSKADPSGVTSTRPRRVRPGRATSGSGDVASASAEVAAATSLWLGDHDAAAQSAKEASGLLADAGETEHGAFWRYVEAHAHFDRGRLEDRALARAALEEAIQSGPQTAWFRRLARTSATLAGAPASADDNDRLFLAWDEWRREAGGRLDRFLARGRDLLTGSHDEQCEGLVYLARLAGASGERPPKTEQSATDCRWSWPTPGRSQRRIWEVKTAVVEERERKFTREDVNQLLGQLEVEKKYASKARLTGCMLDPATEAHEDATEAARDRIRLVSHEAAVRLYDLLADRLRTYATRCGDGSAEARGEARAHVEALLPAAGWLAQLLAPSPQGKVLLPHEVTALFPVR
jgi:hypothetical protein